MQPARFLTFAAELVLAAGLIGWLRAGQREHPEGWGYLLKILGFGAAIAVIAAVTELKFSFRVDDLARAQPALADKYGTALTMLNGAAAALIEELGKYMIGVFSLLSTRHAHRMSDTVTYLIVVGLGFSLAEDAIYFLNAETVPVLRLMSFYLHSGTSAVIGYSLGRFKFGLASSRELAGAVAAAVGLHFAFNLTADLQSSRTSLTLAFAIAVFISLQVFILFRRAVLEEYGLELRAGAKRRTALVEGGRLA